MTITRVTGIFSGRRRTLLGIVCLLALVHARLALAANLPDHTKINIVTENWLPYSYQDASGHVAGLATDLVLRVVEKAGLEFDIGVYPWSRAYSKALHDKNTLIFAMLHSEKRAQLFHMIGQVAPTDNLYFYRLKGREDVVLNTPEEAMAYTVGASRDSAMEAYLITHAFPKKRVVMATANAFTMLERGRVDLVLSSDENAKSLLAENGKPADLYVPLLMVEQSRPFMAVGPNSDPAITEHLRQAYQDLCAEGKLPDFCGR